MFRLKLQKDLRIIFQLELKKKKELYVMSQYD
jgi:hypothetical protein